MMTCWPITHAHSLRMGRCLCQIYWRDVGGCSWALTSRSVYIMDLEMFIEDQARSDNHVNLCVSPLLFTYL